MVSIDEQRLRDAFMEEVTELLENLNEKLLELENDPENKDVINEIFRFTHSVKSESALVGFKNMSTIAHKMEDIFERVRRGVLIVDRSIMDALFSAYDRIMELLTAAQNGEDESSFDISDVVNPLLAILKEQPAAAAPAPAPAAPASSEPAAAPATESSSPTDGEKFGTQLHVTMGEAKDIKNANFTDSEKEQIEEGIGKGETFYKIIFHLEDSCDMRYPRAYLVYNNFVNSGHVIKTIPDVNTEADDAQFGTVEMYYLTDADAKELQENADVDQVDRLELYTVDIRLLNDALGDSGATGVSVDAAAIAEAERKEAEWAAQMAAQMQAQNTSAPTAAAEPAAQKTEEAKESTPVAAAPAKPAEGGQAAHHPSHGSGTAVQKQTIRVDIERLDTLLNLVGELIINRSRFAQIYNRISDKSDINEVKAELEDATNELERITDLMQTGMMQARMVPIGNVFSKFPRMVRDLANQLHKSVDLEIIGENTEIDRTVMELIADPLTHLIRNSIDHGLELPDERAAIGKNRVGSVILKAYQEGSSIYVEVSDDGKGMNPDIIRDKAIEKGICTPQQAAGMSESEIYNFIFEPGFSTKKEITSTSGRGVGMDVVKTQIEKLRGRVDIQTKVGEGTKFIIVLPLTLTIVEALLVNVQKNIFAIPIAVVEETIKIEREDIKDFDDYQVYNLRNETLAVVYLSDLVGLDREDENSDLYIVVVSFERRKIGLVVNNLIGEEDIVIKALDEVLKNNEGIAGATVLGDGQIALILDTSTLVKIALREINKMAENYDFYDENAVSYGLNQLYDMYNEQRKAEKAEKEKAKAEEATAAGDGEDGGEDETPPDDGPDMSNMSVMDFGNNM
ncbi:MAG: chemotaxis protein CheA [Spirochaetales bacterium]|nr:chemotaxis protein CheA [Spirochaetales bacterium]